MLTGHRNSDYLREVVPVKGSLDTRSQLIGSFMRPTFHPQRNTLAGVEREAVPSILLGKLA